MKATLANRLLCECGNPMIFEKKTIGDTSVMVVFCAYGLCQHRNERFLAPQLTQVELEPVKDLVVQRSLM